MGQRHRELVDLSRKCNRCGYCQEVCPTYQVSQNEAAVARGRIQLVDLALGQPATLKIDPDIASYLSSCLLCGSCVAACPSGVQTDWIIKLARNAVLPLSPLDRAKRRLLRAVFGRRVNLYRLTALLRRSDLSRRLVAL
ncbi:MAG TPA: (Fe-S)-binding protein, partial [Firmicutes bacterium]|nr:(Fe-S)-binding protein [Bacillota bacterium]